ncbi:MAG: hypothetical protein QNL04_11770 [SAR324 cluster bacterium]|nr:hypothetical protein [SAR324 cluster bacterium]
MKKQNLYTITILRNMGSPISWTVRARSIVLLTLLAFLIGIVEIIGLVDYLALYSTSKNLNTELEIAKERVHQLDSHLKQIESVRLEAEKGNPLKDGSLEVGLLTQEKFSTQGVWISQATKKTLTAEGMRLEATNTDVELVRDELRFIVRLENSSNPPKEIGGYFCITLVNKEALPVFYKSATGGALGNDGFPSSYKSGVQYFAAPNKMTRVKLNYKLKGEAEFYTHMMVFAYSYKGALLAKKTVPLSKNLFFE